MAARHLHHFGYTPTICYPKPTDKTLYNGKPLRQDAHARECARVFIYVGDTTILSAIYVQMYVHIVLHLLYHVCFIIWTLPERPQRKATGSLH